MGDAIQARQALVDRRTTYQGDSRVSVAANIASRARE